VSTLPTRPSFIVKPEARNRLTAGYMTSYFVGGAAGSLISASAWQHAGWTGVSIAGASFAALNLLVWWRGYQPRKKQNKIPPTPGRNTKNRGVKVPLSLIWLCDLFIPVILTWVIFNKYYG
jgi:cyanate permease